MYVCTLHLACTFTWHSMWCVAVMAVLYPHLRTVLLAVVSAESAQMDQPVCTRSSHWFHCSTHWSYRWVYQQLTIEQRGCVDSSEGIWLQHWGMPAAVVVYKQQWGYTSSSGGIQAAVGVYKQQWGYTSSSEGLQQQCGEGVLMQSGRSTTGVVVNSVSTVCLASPTCACTVHLGFGWIWLPNS